MIAKDPAGARYSLETEGAAQDGQLGTREAGIKYE